MKQSDAGRLLGPREDGAKKAKQSSSALFHIQAPGNVDSNPQTRGEKSAILTPIAALSTKLGREGGLLYRTASRKREFVPNDFKYIYILKGEGEGERETETSVLPQTFFPAQLQRIQAWEKKGEGGEKSNFQKQCCCCCCCGGKEKEKPCRASTSALS